MASTSNFYSGASYPLDHEEEYGSVMSSYHTPASTIGLATDVRTANQIQTTADKLNTGAPIVEIQMTFPQVAESIPDQHLDELQQLKKLVGAELTLHGPLIEPTGIGERRWDESQRVQAEKQMLSAVERAHRLDPDGNIIVTFHSSNGLPPPRITMMNEKGEEVETQLAVINERTGEFGPLPKIAANKWVQKEGVREEVEKINQDLWLDRLQNLNIEMMRAKENLNAALSLGGDKLLREEGGEEKILKVYDLAKSHPEKYREEMEKLQKRDPLLPRLIQNGVDNLSHSNIFVRDAYRNFQELFSQAYEAAEREAKKGNDETLKKLQLFRDEVAPKAEHFKEDPKKMAVLTEEITKGMLLLESLEAPEQWRSLEEFAIDKASETFSNIALKAYDQFKESAPIISIENPPVGMGLTRAAEIKKLIDATREKFVEKAKEKGMSGAEAEKQAEKLIGATWDVGHINMLRKYGYGEKEIVEETAKLAKDIKHVHLSDNFGLEHTELPMGMGNVPTQKHLELIEKYNKQVKKIIEAGNWYEHFKTTPLKETLADVGSPVYSMKMAPYWNQAAWKSGVGGYFAGYGLVPDVHFTTYGLGFAGLPAELGGQIQGRSRLSGAPVE